MRHDHKNQTGATLLLAILILAGLTLTILTVAALTVQEIRSSRAIAVTEPAISAAETAGEQGVWSIKRNTSLVNCTSGQTTQNLGTNTVVTSCKSYASATLTLKANIPLVFYLYDPNNVNGDIDLSEFPYTWLSATHRSGNFQIGVSISRINNGPFVGSTTVSPGASQTININGVQEDTEGRMQVTISSAGNATVDVNTNQGMPDFPTVDATGCSSKSPVTSCSSNFESYTRRINVTVPQ